MKRPFWRISLFVLLTLVNLIGALLTLSEASAQFALSLPYSPTVRAVAQTVCALLLGWTAGQLLRHGTDWAVRRLIAPVLSLYGAWGILWLAAFGRSDYDRGRLPFQTLATVVLLVPFWWAHWRRL